MKVKKFVVSLLAVTSENAAARSSNVIQHGES